MDEPMRGSEREAVARELDERRNERDRQGRGSTPDEGLMERALEIEPGVEQHAGEDSGAVPDAERGEPG